jgi:membrane protease YdiL (CAAX protease family)
MTALFRNRAFWLFTVVYSACFVVLIAGGHPVEDVLASLVILGVILPLLAIATLWRLPDPGAPTAPRPGETVMLVGLLVFVAVFLGIKGSILNLLLGQNPNPRLQEVANTALKLVAFVGLPAAVLRWHHGMWPNPGQRNAPARRLWLSFVVLSAAGIAVQLLLGSEVKRLIGGNYSDRNLLLGLILCFAWMAVEAGLVEEFFFRWLLQSRIAAITGSQVSAIFLMALAFGLAHAPGIWLRGAGVAEGLGAAPSLLTSLAYSVTTQGVAGLMFGVLWARTRSFPLVMLLHAMLDTPANTARFMDLWGL